MKNGRRVRRLALVAVISSLMTMSMTTSAPASGLPGCLVPVICTVPSVPAPPVGLTVQHTKPTSAPDATTTTVIVEATCNSATFVCGDVYLWLHYQVWDGDTWRVSVVQSSAPGTGVNTVKVTLPADAVVTHVSAGQGVCAKVWVGYDRCTGRVVDSTPLPVEDV